MQGVCNQICKNQLHTFSHYLALKPVKQGKNLISQSRNAFHARATYSFIWTYITLVPLKTIIFQKRKKNLFSMIRLRLESYALWANTLPGTLWRLLFSTNQL